MRHLNGYKIFESKAEIDSICRQYGIRNYTIGEDGLIDVDGLVNLSRNSVNTFPLKFGTVTGSFYCSHNELTSLSGCPSKVGGDFVCQNNKLTNLEYSPQYVGEDFHCADNKLTSLSGALKTIDGDFFCNNNKLTSLEGGPTTVNGSLYCYNNKITSLYGLPEIANSFYCNSNPIFSLVYPFIDIKNRNNFIELFNDTDIIQGDKVIYDRLIWFYEEIGLDGINIDDIDKYYTIIR